MAKAPALILTTLLVLGTLLAGVAGAGDLKPGSHGPRVAKVQTWLGQHPDGVFGTSTRAAVKRWQRRHHLHADGVVGPATWRALRRAHTRSRTAGKPVVRSRGGAVKVLQRTLGLTPTGSSARRRRARSSASSARTA